MNFYIISFFMITFFSIGCNNSSMTKFRLVWMSDCIIQRLEDVVTHTCLNSLAPGICINNSESIILKHMLRIKFISTACKIALRWVPQNLTNKKSTLVQVMAWCRQATSHYLSQCWSRSLSPYGVNMPQWVNISWCLRCLTTMNQ